jgi:hypothetical protein
MAAKRYVSTLCSTALALVLLSAPAIAGWDPARYTDESTLEFLTVSPDDGEHWSTVWLVVIDDQVYIRLGSRAAARMDTNTRTPIVSVRIAKEEYAEVEAVPVPEMAEKVAAAMAEKYSTDVFVRYLAHPLTMKLRPKQAP